MSGVLLYLVGVAGEVLVVTSIYLVMPVGSSVVPARARRRRHRDRALGDHRHVLVWYFGTLSQVAVVYGSLTTAIVVLLSLEIAAGLLLFGAQVIAEYERIGTKEGGSRAAPVSDVTGTGARPAPPRSEEPDPSNGRRRERSRRDRPGRRKEPADRR